MARRHCFVMIPMKFQLCLHSAVIQKYHLLLGILQKTDKPECSGLLSLPFENTNIYSKLWVLEETECLQYFNLIFLLARKLLLI